MTELDELEVGIARLKKNSNEQRRYIDELKKERSLLVSKNREIEDIVKRIQGQMGPAKYEINELKKELESVSVLITEMKNKESKLDSMVSEQRSNLLLFKSSSEKSLDRLLDEIENRIRENKGMEQVRFNDLKSKIERLAGMEDRLIDQSKTQKVVVGKLTEDVSRLQQTVMGLSSIKFDTELKNMSKKIAMETKSLLKQISDNTKTTLVLKDKLQYFEPVVNGLSEKLEDQSKTLNRVVGSGESLAKKSERMASELKSLADNFSSEAERVVTIERDLKNQSKGHEKRLDEISGNLGSVQGLVPKVNTLMESVKGLGKDARDLDKRLSLMKPPESIKRWFNDKMLDLDSNLSKSIKKLSKESDDNSELILGLRKKMPDIESLLKHSGEQESMINKIMDFKESLAKKSESVSSELKSLRDRMSEERERIARLEEGVDSGRKDVKDMKKDVEKGFRQSIVGITEGIESNLMNRSDELENDLRSLAKEISSESEKISDNTKTTLVLKDKLQYFEPVVNGLSEKLEDQSKTLNRVVGSKESLAKKSEVTTTELKSLRDRISEERERITRLEDGMDSGRKDIKDMRKDVEKGFRQSIVGITEGIESNLMNRSDELENDLRSLAKEISSESEKMSDNTKTTLVLKDKLQYFEPVVNGLSEKLEDQSKTLNRVVGSGESLAKKSEGMASELKSLADNLSSEAERVVTIERDLKNQSEGHEKRLGGVYDSIGKIEAGEAKRDEKFSNIFGRLQDLRGRTEESLKFMNEKINQVSKIEKNLEKKIHNENEAVFKRLGSNYDELDERVMVSENSISKLNESVKGFGKRIEEHFVLLNDTDKKLSMLDHDLRNQSKNQESHVSDLNNVSDVLNSVDERLLNSEKTVSEMNILIKRVGMLESGLSVTGELNNKIMDLDRRMSGSDKIISQINESIKDIRMLDSSYKKELEPKLQRILEGNTKRLETNIESLTNELSKDREKIARLEEDKDSHVKGIDDIKKQIDSYKKDVESISYRVASDKTDEIKSRLETGYSNLVNDLKSLTSELSSEKREIEVLKQKLNTQSSSDKSRVRDIDRVNKNTMDLKERLIDYEKTVSHISDSVTAMRTRIMDDEGITKKFDEQSKLIDKVTGAGERLSSIEEKIKGQSRDHDLRFTELISVIKDLELGEAKRIDEFNGFVDKFQRLKIKTEQNIGVFNQSVKKLADVESNIKNDINKDNETRFREFGSKFSTVDERVNAAEGLIVQQNDIMEELRSNLENLADTMESYKQETGNMRSQLERYYSREIETKFQQMIPNKIRELETGLINKTETMENKLRSWEDNRESLFADANKLMRQIEMKEASVMKYNDFIGGFQEMKKDIVAIKEKDTGLSDRSIEMNEKISVLRDEVNSRIKVNETMYDSEIDGFKNKLDYVIKELISTKRMQQDFYGMLKDNEKKKPPKAVTAIKPQGATSILITKKPEMKSMGKRPISYQRGP